MRSFHALVFDEVLEGTNPAALNSDPGFNAQLASTEKLMIYSIADTVTGTANLTVQVEESPDGIHWQNRNAAAEINNVSLATLVNIGRDLGANLGTGFARLKVTVSGTTIKAHVRVWATGRGEQGG